jgi:hypothetical protein
LYEFVKRKCWDWHKIQGILNMYESLNSSDNKFNHPIAVICFSYPTTTEMALNFPVLVRFVNADDG